MRESTLEALAPLLDMLRSYEVLEEVRETKFHLNGRDFIHFHDYPDGLWADVPDGLWADVRLTKGQVRMSVSTRSEQAELMEKIALKLDALDTHRNRKGKKQRHR